MPSLHLGKYEKQLHGREHLWTKRKYCQNLSKEEVDPTASIDGD